MVLVKNPVRLNFRTPLSVDFSYLLFCTFLLENNKVFRISYAFLTDFEPQGIKIWLNIFVYRQKALRYRFFNIIGEGSTNVNASLDFPEYHQFLHSYLLLFFFILRENEFLKLGFVQFKVSSSVALFAIFIYGIPEYREHKTYKKIQEPQYIDICLLYRLYPRIQRT